MATPNTEQPLETKLVKVDVAFLFQLAGMTVDTDTPSELYQKAIAVYQAAHKRVAGRYDTLPSNRNPDGKTAYRLQAQAGLAEPRDGAKVFALWFSGENEFSRDAMLDLTTICTSYMHDAAVEAGIPSLFAGARRMRQYETVAWDEVL
jgi:hypothetical protein